MSALAVQSHLPEMFPDNGPLVSAVIPTLCRAELVHRAVLSVLNQTYRNIEVVVVIDGPDPDTLACLANLEDPRLKIIALDENVGGSEARNLGVRAAKGKYVALLDDDDEWLAEKIATQVAISERAGKGLSLVVSQFLARSSCAGDKCLPQRFPRPNQPISEYMFERYSGFQTSTFFCNREIFIESPFQAGLKGCQDLDWFLRVASRRDVELRIAELPLVIFHIAENRKCVSRSMDWKARVRWGRSQRDLMTPRAYSLFLVRACLPKMLDEDGRFGSLLFILREHFLAGRPGLWDSLRFFAILIAPARLRGALGKALTSLYRPGRCCS